MSGTQHTPGRLGIHKRSATTVVNDDGRVIAACGGYANNQLDPEKLACELEANARRLVAAWNACDGVSTEAIERMGSFSATYQREENRADLAEREVAALKAQRDELVEALNTAEAGLIFAGAAEQKQVGEFVPTPLLALRAVQEALANAALVEARARIAKHKGAV